MRWTLIQCDWCPCEKRGSGHRHTQTETMQDTEEGSRLQDEERGLTGNQPCWHLGLGLLASGTAGKYISVVSATQSAAPCPSKPSKRIWSPAFFIFHEGCPWSPISWVSWFHASFSTTGKQAFESLLLFSIPVKRRRVDCISPIAKLQHWWQGRGNYRFFFFEKSEIMLRKSCKKPSISCLAFIWIPSE